MVNRIVLVGRLTADPESQYTTGGTEIAKFRIAVERRGLDRQTGEREADFINIVAFQKTAEFVTRYLTKGRLVAVDGRLQIRQWVAQDGSKRSAAEVVADSVQGLDRPKDQPPAVGDPGADDRGATAPVAEKATTEAPDDMDPFAEE